MSDILGKFNVNPVDWNDVATLTLTLKPTTILPVGETYYFENHPIYSGLISLTGNGSTQLQNLRILLNPRSFTAGRFDSQEKVSTSVLSVAGWYTIATMAIGANRSASADFAFALSNNRSTLKARAQIGQSGSVKDHENTDIEITGRNDQSSLFGGVRIAKSDGVSTAGAKLQTKVLDTTSKLHTLMSMNEGREAGWELVEPFLDNAPVTLPDGVTAATFLEAGEELVIPQFGVIPGTPRKNSDTQIIFTIPWSQIPKQGSSINFDFASAGITLKDGDGTGAVLPETNYTLSAPVIIGELVFFIYTATVGTPFSIYNNGPLLAQINDANMTITIG